MSTAKVKPTSVAATPVAAAAIAVAEDAAQRIEEAVALTRDHVEAAHTATVRSYEDALGAATANFEAAIQASSILGQGFRDLGRTAFGLAQRNVEANLAAIHRLAAAKSLGEAVELQTGFAAATLERAVADGARLADQSVKLTESAFAPIGERLSLAADKLAGSAV